MVYCAFNCSMVISKGWWIRTTKTNENQNVKWREINRNISTQAIYSLFVHDVKYDEYIAWVVFFRYRKAELYLQHKSHEKEQFERRLLCISMASHDHVNNIRMRMTTQASIYERVRVCLSLDRCVWRRYVALTYFLFWELSIALSFRILIDWCETKEKIISSLKNTYVYLLIFFMYSFSSLFRVDRIPLFHLNGRATKILSI